jgi:hypothetical protein
MTPFAESGVASARKQVARCEELLRKAASATRSEEWQLIGEALGAVVTAGVFLDGAMAIEAELVAGTDGE